MHKLKYILTISTCLSYIYYHKINYQIVWLFIAKQKKSEISHIVLIKENLDFYKLQKNYSLQKKKEFAYKVCTSSFKFS